MAGEILLPQRYKTEENKQNGVRLKKSIRAKCVSAHIEWTLRHCTIKSREAYQMHTDKVRVRLAQDTAIAKRQLSEAWSDLKANERHYLKYQQFQSDDPVAHKQHRSGKLERYDNLTKVA